ncbi:MAG: regulatory protein RecX [Pseudobdellovibrio sp.]
MTDSSNNDSNSNNRNNRQKSGYRKRRFLTPGQRAALPKYTLPQAKYKVMELMATRDHSVKEVKKKLSPRCEVETLKLLLDWLQEQPWLPKEEKIQEQVIHALGRRKKGQNYINKKLSDMGLKSVRLNPEIELEKALDCVQNKWDKNEFKGLPFKETQKAKAKVIRFLASRGFDLSTAQKAYNLYFKNNSSSIQNTEDEMTEDNNCED